MHDVLEFVLTNALLFVALLVITGMLIGAQILQKVRGIKAVDAQAALRLINDQNAVILDVRDEQEYKAGHIRGALHIPVKALGDRLGELDKKRPILAYCLKGMRSQSACVLLQKAGFGQIFTLTGGFPAWTEARLPVDEG